eukprot:NODE_1278_length_924_cov_92.032622_g1232_i0.p1 GENE.NODE_1278_length_924_cov_92.032622_g1232_i0~~NODE_1278_length_924_cov_92.032622_g1232_i0.p1  ORF type:complete len:269 (+),score=45.68 NODE_1278_length_924_cov_92.032622_g1232_i0:115-921(+)
MSIVEKVRAACLRRGANGLRGMQRSFRIMDDNHSMTLSKDEFATGMADYGVHLTDQELEEAIAAFDTNGDGLVNVTEFFVAVKGGMNERRRELVQRAFDCLDRDNNNTADLHDVRGRFDASTHPKVISGEMTEDDVLGDFLKTFDGSSNPDSVVTRSEFEAYYAGLSAGIDNDDYFETMLCNAWQLDETPPSNPKLNFSVKQLDQTANLRGTVKQQTKIASREPPKRIVGYTGHVPGASETFGVSFDRIEAGVTRFPNKRRLPQAPPA